MTNEEKLVVMRALIAPDTDTDEILTAMLKRAEALILNKMYPFGNNPTVTAVPARYEQIQIDLAVELYSKRGAEGQTSHSENGISRSWSEKSRLLDLITPHVGSVVSDA